MPRESKSGERKTRVWVVCRLNAIINDVGHIDDALGVREPWQHTPPIHHLHDARRTGSILGSMNALALRTLNTTVLISVFVHGPKALLVEDVLTLLQSQHMSLLNSLPITVCFFVCEVEVCAREVRVWGLALEVVEADRTDLIGARRHRLDEVLGHHELKTLGVPQVKGVRVKVLERNFFSGG